MPNRLTDVTVDELSLVGRPAIRRDFLLFKSENAPDTKPEEIKVKKSDLIERLQKAETEDFDAASLLKVIGVEAPEGDPEPTAKGDDAPSADGDREAALLKRIEELEQRIDDRDNAEIRKRAEALKKFGYDIDPEQATEGDVELAEKLHKRWSTALKEVGLFKSVGVALEREPHASVRDLVKKEVVRQLGREPISKLEEVTIRKRIYDAHPGLAKAALDEERAEVRRRRTE